MMASANIVTLLLLVNIGNVSACSFYLPSEVPKKIEALTAVSYVYQCSEPCKGVVSIIGINDTSLSVYTMRADGIDNYNLYRNISDFYPASSAFEVMCFTSRYYEYDTKLLYVLIMCNDNEACFYIDHTTLVDYNAPIALVTSSSPVLAWYVIVIIVVASITIITGIIFGIVKYRTYLRRIPAPPFEILMNDV